MRLGSAKPMPDKMALAMCHMKRIGQPECNQLQDNATPLPESASLVGIPPFLAAIQFVIYFCLHRGSLTENTAERQPRFQGQKLAPKISVKNYM